MKLSRLRGSSARRKGLAYGLRPTPVGAVTGRLLVAALAAILPLATGCIVASTAVARSNTFTPVLGRSVVISRVAGRVLVEPRGSRAFASLVGRRIIPVGSTVNASNGTVSVDAATRVAGKGQVAVLNSGAFTVAQQRRSPLVNLTLALGRRVVSVCKQGGTAAKRKLSPGLLRTLHASDHGGDFRTRGRYGAATVRGTVWTTEDTCAGTVLSVRRGKIDTTANGAPLSTQLEPGQTVEYQCSKSGASRVSKSYCESVLGTHTDFLVNGKEVDTPFYLASLLTKSTADQYNLCVTGPAKSECNTYPLASPDRSGFRRSVVGCVPDQGAGDYQLTWQISGVFLGQALTYVANTGAPPGVTAACNAIPLAREGYPSDLNNTQTSAHFVIHYDNSPGDPSSITDQDAADVLQTAENALAYETATIGMPRYLDPAVYLGEQGKIDIYALASIAFASTWYPWPAVGQTTFPPLGHPSSGYVVQSNFQQEPVAVSVFEVLDDAIGRLGSADAGLSLNAGRWAAADFDQGQSTVATLAPTLSEPLDCDASCPDLAYASQWRFYEYLSEQFGPGIVPAILSADAQLTRTQPTVGHMDQALEQVLASHGSSLATELGQYAFEDTTNDWPAAWIRGLKYIYDGGSYTTVTVPPTGGSVTPNPTVIQHLASHVLELDVAANTSSPCVEDALTVNVAVPSGGLFPGDVLYTGGDSYPLANPPRSSTVSFNSCNGGQLWLVFTNGTTNVDNLAFQVSGQLSSGGPAPASRRSAGSGAYHGSSGNP